ncbi:hypothetical protein KFK09_029467 [Dendrobium nobile]|uniref:AMMECR1 domain-containing protein n=1 Tax=Dendrobium nobile TaxID=94219 RepID=A0A8T3A0W6_DENNO|nr:hypothetical protein KFK09_029467 [Dendrobium nobile]
MVSANQEMVVYCFDTLVTHYNGEQAPLPAFEDGQHPLFVTWKKAINGGEPRLRGCIGTLEARGLISGLKDYALTRYIRTYITLFILQIGKHGLIIEFTDPDYNTRRSATYLPEVAAHEGWTKIEAIDSLMRKAGYNNVITESLRKRLRITKYQSTLCTMHYTEYITYVKTSRAPINGVKPIH